MKIETYSKVVQYRHEKYQCHNYVPFTETIELSFLGQLQEGIERLINSFQDRLSFQKLIFFSDKE